MVKQMVSALMFVFALMSCGALAASITTLPIRSIYVLGDSLSDQGNLLAATTALGAPSNQPGIPDELHYFEGRFSNGANYVDVLAEKLGISIAPSLEGGTNFAFGGARTTYNIAEQPFGPYPQGRLVADGRDRGVRSAGGKEAGRSDRALHRVFRIE